MCCWQQFDFELQGLLITTAEIITLQAQKIAEQTVL